MRFTRHDLERYCDEHNCTLNDVRSFVILDGVTNVDSFAFLIVHHLRKSVFPIMLRR